MDDKLRTELRWKKIESYISNIPSTPHWIMLIPSMRGGFEALTTPVKDGDFEKTEAHMLGVYSKNHEKGDKGCENTAKSMILALAEDRFHKTFNTPSSFSSAIWWLYCYFKINTDCVEVFKDKKIVLIDINMIQIPTTKPTLH
jgi:hypothetical protein